MGMQNRRGVYDKFDPQKMIPGEWAVVISGDEHAIDGKAVYMCFAAGDVKRMATYEDMLDYLATVIEDANEIIVADMVEKTALADASAIKADAAASNAEAATSSANIAASKANEAYHNYEGNRAASAETADNASTADKLKEAHKSNGIPFDGTTDIIYSGTCTTAAETTAKTVDIPGYSITNDAVIAVHFVNGITVANATLNVSETGAFPIQYRSSNLPANVVPSNANLLLRYYSARWYVVGELNGIENADSGWLSLPLASGVTSANGTACYRKIGKTVEVRAIVSSTAALGGSYDEVSLATLPSGYRPPQMIAELQHASNYHIYQVRINVNGTITASRARTTYTAGAHTDIPAGGLIYIHTTFMID